jgi:predicted nucleotide-binding protein
LEKVELKVTILRELPNKGRTIIEKLIDSSDVGYAVILLTGDDRGGIKTAAFENQKLRARQNVILELGYFIAKLGRGKVCAIYEDGVEIPSDYQGVLFIPYDETGLWKYTLANELQAAGIPVDKNKID